MEGEVLLQRDHARLRHRVKYPAHASRREPAGPRCGVQQGAHVMAKATLWAALALVVAWSRSGALAHAAPPRLFTPLERGPLEAPLRPTGSFGEYRIGHFHAGLDFATDERVGLPVIAPARGRVVRVRASGIGYGRSIYLQAHDGRLMVFGHLDAFDEPLASYVAGVQDSTGQYEQDLWPDSTRFPVTAGRRLGWSGRSGTGPPHLHFEIRRGDMAINPLLAGVSVTDTSAPVIQSVTFEPMDDHSSVEGSVLPLTLVFAAESERAGVMAANDPPMAGEPTSPRRIRAKGRVRMIVEAVDARPNGRLTMAPWSVSTDGTGAGVECRFDSVSWADGMSEVDFVYDRGRATDRGSTSVVLWAPPSFRPRMLSSPAPLAEEAGTLVIGPDDHERVLRVAARDVAGNHAEREVKIVADDRPARPVKVDPQWFQAEPHEFPTGNPERVELEVGDLVPDLPSSSVIGPDDVRFTSLPGGFLRVEITGARWREARPYALSLDGLHALEVGPRPAAVFRPASLPHEEALRIAGPGPPIWSATTRLLRLTAAREGASEGFRGFHWRIPAGALFEPATWVAARGSVVRKARELVPVGPMFTLHPVDHPLRAPIQIDLDVPSRQSDPRLGLYRDSGDGWEFIRASLDSSARRLTGETRRLGRFALFRDLRAPRIEKTMPPKAAAREPYARWTLETRLDDQGSGVDARATAFEVDGRVVPSEWDAEERTLRWRPLWPPATGHHRFRVIATDRAGNVAHAKGTFVID